MKKYLATVHICTADQFLQTNNKQLIFSQLNTHCNQSFRLLKKNTGI